MTSTPTTPPEMSWTSRRISVELDDDFDTAVAKYEQAAPPYPAVRFAQLAAARTPWADIVRLTKELTPFGFLIYNKSPADMLMSLAGHQTRCVVYLMGNHVKAEAMYRHDPTAMLYVPMRTIITKSGGTKTRFSFDQPSSQLDSLNTPSIATTGREIDRQLATLLTHLDWPVPSCLTTDEPARDGTSAPPP